MKKSTPLARLKKKCVDKATEIKLQKTPVCEGNYCNNLATTSHHLIRQANSNYLRTSQVNLFSTCRDCHCLAHSRGDMVAFGNAIIKRGKRWNDKLMADRQIRIRDNQEYWKNILKDLEEQLKK